MLTYTSCRPLLATIAFLSHKVGIVKSRRRKVSRTEVLLRRNGVYENIHLYNGDSAYSAHVKLARLLPTLVPVGLGEKHCKIGPPRKYGLKSVLPHGTEN